MELIILVFWIGFSGLVGLVGKSKTVGFWGTFILSLLLSPIIGLIIALVSGEKKVPKVLGSVLNLEKAKKAEHRGDIQEAIKYYNDVVYDLQNAPKTKESILRKHREKQLAEAQSKIKELNKLA